MTGHHGAVTRAAPRRPDPAAPAPPPYVPWLQCYVRGLSYDFAAKVGRLDMSDGGCCDMDGCIQAFRAIDPKVRRIETYADGEKDTFYELNAKGRWCAISREGARYGPY